MDTGLLSLQRANEDNYKKTNEEEYNKEKMS